MPKASPSYNLLVLRPDLARQWHPTKNGGLSPRDVTPGSSQKAWWLCENGHWWEARVRDRVRGMQCSFCRDLNKDGDRRMADLKPELLREWHPTKNRSLKVRDVSSTHVGKVWWLCHNGHEWEATVRSRLMGKTCPRCLKPAGTAVSLKERYQPPVTAAPVLRESSSDERIFISADEESSSQYHGAEKRKAPRYERSAVAMIEIAESGMLGYARMLNFSAAGILLASDFPLKPGLKISIKLDKPIQPAGSNVVRSKVIWCRNLEDLGENAFRYSIGVSIV